MDPNAVIALLLTHLGETTSERDAARAQVVAMRNELDGIKTELLALQDPPAPESEPTP